MNITKLKKRVLINIKIGELGEMSQFIRGMKYWYIQHAEISNKKFKIGDKVSFFDEENQIAHTGLIDWMIVTENGNVEVSITDIPLGRIDLESIEQV